VVLEDVLNKSQYKILLADDEERMIRLLNDYLKKEDYQVLTAEDGKRAFDLFLENTDIDLVVLDVMMPFMDGWSVCREIRKRSKVPVIMLTARSEESDELFGFDLGADEYIKKPFSPGVLIARIKALLRRSQDTPVNAIEIGSLKIDPERHSVEENGAELDLSPKEFELLLYLVNHSGVTLSRDRILNAVWGVNYYGDGRTVDTHIKRLRNKLTTSAVLIETIRGYGYRFEGKK
jgi:DNA-binding response OmpR family regulator